VPTRLKPGIMEEFSGNPGNWDLIYGTVDEIFQLMCDQINNEFRRVTSSFVSSCISSVVSSVV
jgi:hypothetical protein